MKKLIDAVAAELATRCEGVEGCPDINIAQAQHVLKTLREMSKTMDVLVAHATGSPDLSNVFDFSAAIALVKYGQRVARKGWNGKDMFLFLRSGRKITGVDPDSPMGGDFESLPHICMKNAQGKCVVGWLASQSDMLADDWYVVSG